MAESVVRKDIEMTGATGTTGIGYVAERLIGDIERFLGWDNPHDAFLVGAGHLGSALLGHEEFRGQGLNIVAVFDVDSRKIGRNIQGLEILPIDKMPSLARRLHVTLGVLAVPPDRAQEVADLFVQSGINRIWSFASPLLSVPPEVTVQREDLSAGLAELLVRSSGRVSARTRSRV